MLSTAETQEYRIPSFIERGLMELRRCGVRVTPTNSYVGCLGSVDLECKWFYLQGKSATFPVLLRTTGWTRTRQPHGEPRAPMNVVSRSCWSKHVLAEQICRRPNVLSDYEGRTGGRGYGQLVSGLKLAQNPTDFRYPAFQDLRCKSHLVSSVLQD